MTTSAMLERELGSRVSTDADDLRQHAGDWWPILAKWSGVEREEHMPAAVLRPQDSAAVARAITVASSRGLKVVAYGAGSGVTGAVVSRSGALVIDTRALDRIVEFDADNGMVTAEAGVMGGFLEGWLNERGWTLGHYPQSLHLSTVGGWVATNSSGTFSAKYGGIEELLVGLEVVTPTGELVRFKPVPRAATGPRLMQLFVGSEGSLGIVTQVTLRIFKLPQSRRFAAFAPASLEQGLGIVKRAYEAHLQPALLRLYDPIEAMHLYEGVGQAGGAPLLLVGHEGLDAMVQAEASCFEQIALAAGARPVDAGVAKFWEAGRYNAEWYRAGNEGADRIADSIEVAAPWTQLPSLYRNVMEALKGHCTKAMGHFSHFYSTGSSLYIIAFLQDGDAASLRRRYELLWSTVMEQTLAHGGTISHHHGVGLARATMMAQELGSAHAILDKIKKALDPKGALNPGKFGLREGK
jgi:alkyldihydroxyacetonephosphate synthase